MSETPDAMAVRLAALWEKSQALVWERVELLVRAAAEAKAGSLGAEGRAEAHATAHKLAGSLGMFGRGEAGETARRLEVLFEHEPVDADAVVRESTALSAAFYSKS